MKNINVIIFLLAMVINTIAGIVLKDYKLINLILSDAVIALSFLLQMKLNKSNASDGYKIALTFIAPVFSLISFVLAVLLPNKIENNLLLILLICSISLQIIITIMPLQISKLFKNN